MTKKEALRGWWIRSGALLAVLITMAFTACSTSKTIEQPESSPELDYYGKVLVRYRDCVFANARVDRGSDLTPVQIAQKADAACRAQFDILREATEKYVVGRAPPAKLELATSEADHQAEQVRGRVLSKAALVVEETRAHK